VCSFADLLQKALVIGVHFKKAIFVFDIPEKEEERIDILHTEEEHSVTALLTEKPTNMPFHVHPFAK
jgi:hypothetical protein